VGPVDAKKGRPFALVLFSTKTSTIFTGRQPDNPSKYLPEGCRIAVTDFPGDAVYGKPTELQHLARLAHTQPLAILPRRHARRFLKTTQESTFFQSGSFGKGTPEQVPRILESRHSC
jgi:hypothetical protein